MRLSFFGGAQTVTGSMDLLSVNGKNYLIECGLRQGPRQECYEWNTHFPFAPPQIDAVLLTHAHTDHSGNLPGLVRRGFTGPIYATPPTVDLCDIMLRDSAHLQERDLEWANRIRAKQHLEPMEPMYSMEDAQAAIAQFVGVDYNRPMTLGPGVELRFIEGGHILGSASIQLTIKEDRREIAFGYAGDIGRLDAPVIQDPNLPQDLDILVMESTYGNRFHDPLHNREEQLAEALRDAAAGGGKLIIPAFAVGRTQEIVYLLHKLYNEDRVPDIPIYVDSPMAVEATNVFRRHPECFDRETWRIFTRNGEDPFEFKRLTYVKDVGESKRLNELRFPHVIISASGMAEGGRVLHHLRNSIGERSTIVLFVGYAVKETLARRLIDGNTKVRIFGEEHEVRAQIRALGTFSAHADRRDLLDYVKLCPPAKLANLFLVHGEPDQALPLRDAFRSKGYPAVHYPSAGEAFDL
jgi:metallo-beta-lactamase family protein